ncbi:hypothetical protein L484_000801 [Morus notabilis]|uniref:Cyclin n=2 Tax=Morus notabilis TaxID=981085 RepID=W9SLH1_9ROSA|nr:hypothetical protein L484_000801 [Morus notabilis]
METTRFDGIDGFSEICIALGLEEYEKTNYSSSPPKILQIVAYLLEKSIQKNERLLRVKSRIEVEIITIFHGSKAPAMSMKRYVERIFKYSNCSTSCYVFAYIYIERFLQKRASFYLTSLTVHRLLITSVMLAAKFLDDATESNAYYAEVGGVSTEEMNELEMAFLFSLEFSLLVTAEDFAHYCQYLEVKVAGEIIGLRN